MLSIDYYILLLFLCILLIVLNFDRNIEIFDRNIFKFLMFILITLLNSTR